MSESQYQPPQVEGMGAVGLDVVVQQQAILERQQQQYAEYVRRHHQRQNGGGGAGGVNAGRSPLGDQQLEARLLELGMDPNDLQSEGMDYDPVLETPDGRRLRGWSALKYRSSVWVEEHVSWNERSGPGKILFLFYFGLILFIASYILSIGASHLNDEFADSTTQPATDSNSQNECKNLPIYLILTSVMCLIGIIAIFILVILTALGERRTLESVSFHTLLFLMILGSFYLIWFIIGNVWTFNSSDCNEELQRGALFTIISTYIITGLQICITCMRGCGCQKDILPV